MKRKLVSILLCLAVCLAMMPTAAFAEEPGGQNGAQPAVSGEDSGTGTTEDPDASFDVKVIANGSGTVSASKTTDVKAEEKITLTATPAEGFYFKEWKVVKGDVRIENNAFTMPRGDVEIEAVFTEPIAINETNFPDATFRDYVSKEFDTDKDGKLVPEEINQAEIINCYDKGENLKSLQGVEYFTELTSLNCYRNALTALDVSQNTKLTSLECSENQLMTLDVSQNTKLTDLSCNDNLLTTLDISRNTELLRLYCHRNGLTGLDVKQNAKLSVLNCSGNQLSTLDISGNTALTWLICSDNQLTELDLSKNTALDSLSCGNNQLVCLDLRKNVKLTNLYSENTEGNARFITVGEDRTFDLSTFKDFDANKASDWEGGSVSGNTLTVDEGAAVVTYTYQCSDELSAGFVLLIEGTAAKTIAIDETNFPDANFRAYITAQDYDRNQDGKLSEGELAMVKTMHFTGEQISDLTGIEHFTELKELSCDGNLLTALDVSRNTKLKYLDCSRNQLTSLNVSKNLALKELSCDGNRLTSLDIRANNVLTTLSCDGNAYTLPLAEGESTFDLSGLPGFDVSIASNWQGGSVSGNTLTISADAEEVTYTYDCGNDKAAEFTLNLPSFGKVAVPAFSPNGGSFTGILNVIITCATAGADIYYSLDGGGSYNRYTGPVTLKDTATVTAYAEKARMKDSDPVSATFTKTTSSGGSTGGSTVTPVQRPEIQPVTGGKTSLSQDGSTLEITPDEGMEIGTVTVNGKEVTVKDGKITGLKTGDKVQVTFKAKAPTKEEQDQNAVKTVKNLKLTVRTSRTPNRNVKAYVKADSSLNAAVAELKAAGYTVKYKFYRSAKKASGYQQMLTKNTKTYVNTMGSKNTCYYYKIRLAVCDADGRMIAQTDLKQCRYGSRVWNR